MTRQGQRIGSGYPLGVLVIMIIMVLRCVTIAAGLLDVAGSPFADWLRANSPMPEFTGSSDLDIVVKILFAGLLVASLLVIVGLLARRQWAWALAIVTCGIMLALNLGWWYGGEARYGSMLL